jgi:VanZ family protein
MSTSPAMLNPSQLAPRRMTQTAWIPVYLSLAFVCCTSTRVMGGSHTQVLVDDVWQAFLGKWHFDMTGLVNEACRKVGHFLGYGMIGLIFRNAWNSSFRTRVMRIGGKFMSTEWMVSMSALSVLCTFIVACLDEWHQRYVPGRVSSFRDVMVDTTGAIFLNIVFWTVRARNRRKSLNAW